MRFPINSDLHGLTNSSGLEVAVGHTPLVKLRRVTAGLSPKVEVYAKAEWFNPSGSVKDRPALNILLEAVRAGRLEGGRRLLDSTSGNMGIAYATLGAALDIPVTLAIPSSASSERFTVLNALDVELLLSDPLEGSDGAIEVARKVAQEHPERYYYADQYNNKANWQAHFQTTGPEIWEQSDRAVTHFVSGLGTSGTMTGVGKFLREQKEGIELVAFQPDSPFHGLEGLKHMPTSILPGIYDSGLPDRTLGVSTEAAYEMTRRLASQEGLFVGISSGAAAVAALEVAAELEQGMVVTIFPDSGYKYVSDRLWERPK